MTEVRQIELVANVHALKKSVILYGRHNYGCAKESKDLPAGSCFCGWDQAYALALAS
jgi:hypothetical protein